MKAKNIIKKALIYLRDNHYIPFFSSVEVSLVFVNEKKMQRLNLLYRGKDKTTDVLSFPQLSLETQKDIKNYQCSEILLGDIIINIHQAKRQADEQGIPLHREVSWLLIHGLLHLLGYDHEINRYQARKMKRLESEILEEIA